MSAKTPTDGWLSTQIAPQFGRGCGVGHDGKARDPDSRHEHATRLPKAVGTMNDTTYGHTASGTPITDELIEKLADQAEHGFDVDDLITRRAKDRKAPPRRRTLDRRVIPTRPKPQNLTRRPRRRDRTLNVRNDQDRAPSPPRSQPLEPPNAAPVPTSPPSAGLATWTPELPFISTEDLDAMIPNERLAAF